VRETETFSGEEVDTQDIAEELMGVGMDEMEVEESNNGVDLHEMTRRARMWADRNTEDGQVQGGGSVDITGRPRSGQAGSVGTDTGVAVVDQRTVGQEQEQVTDVVDLSSSDDDMQNDHLEDVADFGLSFNISDVRSLVPPALVCASDQSPSTSKKTVPNNPAPATNGTGSTSTSNTTGSTSHPSSSTSSNTHDDVSAHSELKYFKTGPLASLWSYEGSVGPLISPEMGGSLREVYSRLIMDPPTNNKYTGQVEELVVTYDLYLAENYKKSQKIIPDYRVIIQSFSSPLPNPHSLAKLDKLLPDQVPFLFAVVNGATVTFFSLDKVELPRYFRDI